MNSAKTSYTKNDLIQFEPTHETFVGIDSDGCVFDTMGVKQVEHFQPLIIKFWGLEKIGKHVRAASSFVNLYSQNRGSNRFPALLKCFELLKAWPEAAEAGVPLPDTEPLASYVNSNLPLGNPSLKEEADRTGDGELQRVLDWSLAVNRDIAENMKEVNPFSGARECLENIHAQSDSMVVSQTPEEALVHEWRLNGIDGFVSMIAGQELGTKTEHLRMATGGKYDPGRVLMIGDAPGDRKAAEAVGAFFFPINPGDEEASWKELHDRGYETFLDGTFGGTYQETLIEGFEARLQKSPPWMHD